MEYVLYKEGYDPFKTTYSEAADRKLSCGWRLVDKEPEVSLEVLKEPERVPDKKSKKIIRK